MIFPLKRLSDSPFFFHREIYLENSHTHTNISAKTGARTNIENEKRVCNKIKPAILKPIQSFNAFIGEFGFDVKILH